MESQKQQAQISARHKQTNVKSTVQQAQGTSSGQEAQGISTGQQAQITRTGQEAQGTSTGQQAQGTRTRQQTQGTSTGQQAQGTRTRQQAQGTSTRQQAQGTSTGQQAQGTSTGQQAQGTSTGHQAQGTRTRQQAQGSSTRIQPQGKRTRHQAQGRGTRKQAQGTRPRQQAQGTYNRQQAQCTSTRQQAQGTSIRQQAQGTSTRHKQAQGTSAREQAPQVAAAEALWRQSIRVSYPDLHSKTYFLPPIPFNKVSYDVQSVAGLSVLVPQKASDQPGQAPAYFPPTGPPPHLSDPPLAAGVLPPYQLVPPGPLPVVGDSDVREYRAMQQVLDCIRVLAEREQQVMLVLSQLEFRKYLDNQVDPITAAAILLLPRPATLAARYEDGDFGVLMINSRYGLIVGEIKSVGADLSKIPDLDKAVVKAVEKAIKQLNRAKELLKHLVSDLARINITKTLMLPNVTSEQLSHALSTDRQVQQALCQCVGVVVTDPAAAAARCLTADRLTSSEWWWRAVTDLGPDRNMTRELYEVLVARFCGPATTIEVHTVTKPRRTAPLRTLSEAVALTGLTMAMLTLYPDQVDLVNSPGLPRVFLWGPPGTGKTVILVIKGMQWGHQGKDVHLVSSHRPSRAAILLIERQLQHSLGGGTTSTPTSPSTPASASTPTSGPRIYTHFYDFEDNQGDVEAAVDELASAARDGELFVIADEAFCGSVDVYRGRVDTSRRFAKFCTGLYAQVPELHLWVAAVERHVTPACLCEKTVTTPVRCPPAVVRQVASSNWIKRGDVPRYDRDPAPASTDGPEVRQIRHRENSWSYTPSPGHTGDWPEDCKRCAEEIAHLMQELRVGNPDCDLQHRDVFILCRDPRDNLPVVTILRARHLPVKVVTSSDDEAAIRDVALAECDAVTVTHSKVVRGLERRVVVVMGWGSVAGGDSYRERLNDMSRCTSLLVWVGKQL